MLANVNHFVNWCYCHVCTGFITLFTVFKDETILYNVIMIKILTSKYFRFLKNKPHLSESTKQAAHSKSFLNHIHFGNYVYLSKSIISE